MTGETARAPKLSHRNEQAMAIAAPARPCEPLAHQWKGMYRVPIGPGFVGRRRPCDGVGNRDALASAFQHGVHEDSTEDYGEACGRDGRYCLACRDDLREQGQTSALHPNSRQ